MLILSYENEFNLHVNENSFSYERMSTKTRFEKEATGNSEMACSLVWARHRRGKSSKMYLTSWNTLEKKAKLVLTF